MTREILAGILTALMVGFFGIPPVFSTLPDYLEESQFLSGTPGVIEGPASAYFNPALWRGIKNLQLSYIWTELRDGIKGREDWGLFCGVPNFGFGMRRHRLVEIPERPFMTDYKIGFGMGDRNLSLGMSYGWSKIESGDAALDSRITLGSLFRPSRHFSVGIFPTFSQKKDDRVLVGDLGVRPFGAWLTFFGDVQLLKKDRLKDIRGGYGVEVEPLPGVYFGAKIQSDKQISFRMAIQLGPMRGSVSPHYDKDRNLTKTSYTIHFTGPDRCLPCELCCKKRLYVELNLKGVLTYQRYKFLDEGKNTLLPLLDLIERAKDDPKVGGLVLNLSGMEGNRELLWEIRDRLEAFKSKRKKVLIYIDRGGLFEYYLASVADRLWIDPLGVLDMPGLVMGRTFYKRALEKLGIGFDELRFFTYKSAMEAFSREKMSEADREQRFSLIQDFFSLVSKEIKEARHFSDTHFDSIINQKVLLSSKEALELGLVDSIGGYDKAKDFVKEVKGHCVSSSFYNALRPPSHEWSEPPKIAIVYAIGVCDMEQGINARRLVRVLKQVREDPEIKAVVFRADSPGGDALPSDLVALELEKTKKKKPVIVSQGAVAGSGGYWISMNGDAIVASPLTITGSVGVIGGWFWNQGLGEKIGLTSDHVKLGEHADLDFGITLPFLGTKIPDRSFTPQERTRMEELFRDLYQEFVHKVAKGRGLKESKVDSIGQGRVWSGIQGKTVGLVDELGGLWQAIEIAKKKANIPPSREVELVELPAKGLINWAALSPAPPPLSFLELKEEDLEYLKYLAKQPGQPVPIMEPIDFNQ